ncbi:MAG: sigma-70 family RNA polymerase sigma factor [Anaerolineae bacterium]|nr:sigma-70 family RNA polymerase sigma factor [Anaerolineae bacterium]
MIHDQPLDDLIRQVQQASDAEREQLLNRLVMQFAESAYRWARVILDDDDKAHDAVQEAWLNAYLHLDQLRERAAFPGWFRQIVISACYRVLRGEKPSVSLSEQLPEEAARQPSPVEEVENNERLEHIREAVLTLPDGERVVTELFYFDDYSQQEIAEMLAVPVTTIKKRLQYARRRLKTVIQPETVAQLDCAARNGGCTAAAFGMVDRDDMALIEWLPPAFAAAAPFMTG